MTERGPAAALSIGALREALIDVMDLNGAWGENMHESKEALIQVGDEFWSLSRVKEAQMTEAPWIVHHRDGWCALPPGAEPGPEALSDPTLCGFVVTMRGGHKRGCPDCPECLALLAAPRH